MALNCEQGFGIGGCCVGHAADFNIERGSDMFGDQRYVGALVALSTMGHGRKIGRIRLQ